jgi:hypothetical protein
LAHNTSMLRTVLISCMPGTIELALSSDRNGT